MMTRSRNTAMAHPNLAVWPKVSRYCHGQQLSSTWRRLGVVHGGTHCQSCTPGRYHSTQDLTCKACPYGKVAVGVGHLQCRPCKPGNDPRGNACGPRQSCVPCPKGTYNDLATDQRGSQCRQCALYKVADRKGMAACVRCPTGSFPNERHTACITCRLGYRPVNETEYMHKLYRSSVRGYIATWMPKPNPCSPVNDRFGRKIWYDKCGASARGSCCERTQIRCRACPAGTFSSTSMDSCVACEPGYVADAASGSCARCPAGTYEQLRKLCVACGSGKFSSTGSSTCTSQCKRGWYADSKPGSSVCFRCSKGSYTDTGDRAGATACLACRPGMYNTDGISCIQCLAGSGTNKRPGQPATKCIECEAGRYGDGEACRACAKGAVSPHAGMRVCRECGAEKFSYNTTTCVTCLHGSHTNTGIRPGASTCAQCDVGRHGTNGTVCVDCSPGQFLAQMGKTKCVECRAGSQTDTGSAGGAVTCDECTPGRYSALGQTCTHCAAGRYSLRPGSTSCEACKPGHYAPPLSVSCTACAIGRYAEVDASPACLPCDADKSTRTTASTRAAECTVGCPDPEEPCTHIYGSRARHNSQCPEGTDIDMTFNRSQSIDMQHPSWQCVPCPHLRRCPNVGGCSDGATGNLCGSCDDNHFNLGPICAQCADSNVLPVLFALGLLGGAMHILWRLTKIAGVSAVEINCVLSFGSHQGDLTAAQHFKADLTRTCDWAAESVYLDYDASEDLPGKRRVPVIDDAGEPVRDPSGRLVSKSVNDDWHVFFREGLVQTPAMVFVLTQSWCESALCKVELVWWLVLKTMGAEALLQTEIGQAPGHTTSESMVGATDLRRESVVFRIERMTHAERAALWDGSFFLINDSYSQSCDVLTLLTELGCPNRNIFRAVEQERLIIQLEQYVTVERQSPELLKRRKNFVNGYAGTPVHRQASGTVVDSQAMRGVLSAEASQLSTHLQSMLASIVLPHFSFSLLPLLLPHVHWPPFISHLASWLRSVVFLDWGLLARPECFIKGATPTEKRLLRFMTSHIGFGLMIAAFLAFGCFRSRRVRSSDTVASGTKTQTAAAHAVNASVWAFVLLQVVLLQSCLRALQCVGGSHASHILSEPAVACDLTVTWSVLGTVCTSGLLISFSLALSSRELVAPLTPAQMKQLQRVFEWLVAHQPAADDSAWSQVPRHLEEWLPDDVCDIDTEDGMEFNCVVLGPSTNGDDAEMQVQFSDGSLDDWPKADFHRPLGAAPPLPRGFLTRAGLMRLTALYRRPALHVGLCSALGDFWWQRELSRMRFVRGMEHRQYLATLLQFVAISNSLGAEPSVGWTQEQFCEWCRRNHLANLYIPNVSHVSTDTVPDATHWTTRHPSISEKTTTLAIVATTLAAILVLPIVFQDPNPNVHVYGNMLPILGGLGLLIYGLVVPLLFYRKLLAASATHTLNGPECRNRFGFLLMRFKPNRWGHEFRIIIRKSALLVAATAFAQQWWIVIPLQLLILVWAMHVQFKLKPFLEVGFARRAYLQAHPEDDGWSRGDRLEMLSLWGQIGNVLLSLLCAVVVVKGVLEIAVVVATLACLLAPAFYGVRILFQEYLHPPLFELPERIFMFYLCAPFCVAMTVTLAPQRGHIGAHSHPVPVDPRRYQASRNARHALSQAPARPSGGDDEYAGCDAGSESTTTVVGTVHTTTNPVAETQESAL